MMTNAPNNTIEDDEVKKVITAVCGRCQSITFIMPHEKEALDDKEFQGLIIAHVAAGHMIMPTEADLMVLKRVYECRCENSYKIPDYKARQDEWMAELESIEEQFFNEEAAGFFGIISE